MHSHPPKTLLILPNPLAALLGTFSGLFSGRIWQQVQILVGGVILCPSKRTVRARLRIRGLAADRRHGQSQRGLSRAAWASCLGAPPLLKPLIGTLVATGGLGWVLTIRSSGAKASGFGSKTEIALRCALGTVRG